MASPNHHRSQADAYESSVASASVRTVTPFVALIAVLTRAPPTTRASTERTRSSAGVKPILATSSAPTTAASVLPTEMPAATARRRAAGGVGGERPDRHGRPEAHAEDEEGGEGDAGRRPDRRDHAVGDVEAHPELRRAEVGARDQREPGSRPGRADLTAQRPVMESAVHRLRGLRRAQIVTDVAVASRRRRPASAAARSPAAPARSRPRGARSPRAARGGTRRTRRGRSGRGRRG